MECLLGIAVKDYRFLSLHDHWHPLIDRGYLLDIRVRFLGCTATLSRGIINHIPVYIRDSSGSLPLLLLLRWLLRALGCSSAWGRGSSEDGSTCIAIIVSCGKHAHGNRGEASLGPS
jgi:hypothetical protein